MSIPNTIKQDSIFMAIAAERDRQEQLLAQGKFPFTCANPHISDDMKLPVLGEEFGEVCTALMIGGPSTAPGDTRNLKMELLQVAAVAVAWLESLE